MKRDTLKFCDLPEEYKKKIARLLSGEEMPEITDADRKDIEEAVKKKNYELFFGLSDKKN